MKGAHEALSLAEELWQVKAAGKRERGQFPSETWLLLGCTCSSGWPYTYAQKDSTEWIMKRGHGVGRGCGIKGVQEELNGGEGLIQSNKNDYTHTPHIRSRDAPIVTGPRKANINGCCRGLG